MESKNILEKISDVFMFRISSPEELDTEKVPYYTPGSITWGIMLRTAIMVIISVIGIGIYGGNKIAYSFLILIWIIAIYPGFRQFQEYYKNLEKITEETMCGSCRHFDETSQLCKIYDEHITKDYLPCQGENWELKDIEN